MLAKTTKHANYRKVFEKRDFKDRKMPVEAFFVVLL
jgi:hypothetical protein